MPIRREFAGTAFYSRTFFVLVRICFEGILLIMFHQNILAQVGFLILLAFLLFYGMCS